VRGFFVLGLACTLHSDFHSQLTRSLFDYTLSKRNVKGDDLPARTPLKSPSLPQRRGGHKENHYETLRSLRLCGSNQVLSAIIRLSLDLEHQF
jgi:hypothetical protein